MVSDDDRCGTGSATSIVHPFRTKHRQLPRIGLFIVADEIRIAVRASQLEISVVGRQPRVDHLGDVDATGLEYQRAGCLLAAVAGVALDANDEERLVGHALTITPRISGEIDK
jgi:hypothetical protein